MKLFLQPSMVLLFLLCLAAALSLMGGRVSGIARQLFILSAALYVVLGFSPLPRALLVPLENRFPQQSPDDLSRAPTGIVVLGGAAVEHITRVRQVLALNETAERLTVAAELARKFPNAKLLVSGNGTRIDQGDGFAEHTFFENLGISRDRVIYEEPSSNTYENATAGVALANPKPGELWLLITTASHMPRAVGAFRQAGFAVKPWPVDYRTSGWADAFAFFDKPSQGLTFADEAIIEWIGLVGYWLAGRTSTLFPAPESEPSAG